MYVVWISSHHPALGEGGAAAHEYELIRAVAARHRIHVICAGLEPRAFPELERIGVSVDQVIWHETPRPPNRLSAYWRLAAKSAGVALWRQGDKIELLDAALRRYQTEHRVDLVNVVMGDIAPVVVASGAPTSLLIFDVFTRHGERQVAAAHGLRASIVKMGHLRSLRRWEREWYPRASALACVSAPDAHALTSLLSRPVDVIPNPISDDFFTPQQTERSPTTVSFIATLDYEPNIEGLRWLVEAVWPEVLRRRRDATLEIVGWKPTDDVYTLAGRVGASVHPSVDDVRPFYWRSAVSVAPMHLGAGLRNKILHAMACRAPVVTTSAAVEGIPVVDGHHLLIRDDAPGFAGAIASILDDPASARARADAAVACVAPYAASAVGRQLEDWWDRTRAKTGGDGRAPAPNAADG